MLNHNEKVRISWLGFASLVLLRVCLSATEIVTLSPKNYDDYAPKGKEVDAIYGDFVIRNDKLTAVIGNTDLISGRSASRWAIPNVAGCVIDLTTRRNPNDQLLAYYPGPLRYRPDAPQRQDEFEDEAFTYLKPGRKPKKAETLTLPLPAFEIIRGRSLEELARLPAYLRGKPRAYIEISYTLSDGWPYLLVEQVYKNPTPSPVNLSLTSRLLIDRAVQRGLSLDNQLYWLYDKWWGQAYGILAENYTFDESSPLHLTALINGKHGYKLQPGGAFRIAQRLIPASNLFEVFEIACRLKGIPLRKVRIEVADSKGPVPRAEVSLLRKGRLFGSGKTNEHGLITANIPEGSYELSVSSLERGEKSIQLDTSRASYRIEVPVPGIVSARITDESGSPIPCKVEFRGTNGTSDPYFFPWTGEHLAGNLYYSNDGDLRLELPPGRYRVIASHGPEYDIAKREIEVRRGRTVRLNLRLAHSVKTQGWISADLHNHSTLSNETMLFYVWTRKGPGYSKDPMVDVDSYASPVGRVLNLLCEGIEFAPPTEHNYISDFRPILKKLGVEKLIATCPGIGLTAGRRHTITHQNAFPVIYKPHYQDGGAIQRPQHIRQLDWLMKWYGRKEKLIQVNFPLHEKLSIRKGTDVLDVHTLLPILRGRRIKGIDNRILDWLEKLKEGYRIPAVVNSGAYHNFHGSGGVRNYIRVPIDDPAQVKVIDIVRSLKRGHIIMTTGPFLEFKALSASSEAIPGDQLISPEGNLRLRLRAQCPNWITIDRIQILINGECSPELTFTRKSNPALFFKTTVQFNQTLDLKLNNDSFIIAIASGEGFNLRGGQEATTTQIAVSNPVWVDVGGDGYEPHSPLDDKVISRIQFLKSVLAESDAEPGRLRIFLRNTPRKESRDKLSPEFFPERAVEILDPGEKPYIVPPLGEAVLYFDLRLTRDYLSKAFPVIPWTYVSRDLYVTVPRSPVGVGRKSSTSVLPVEHPAMILPAVKTLDEVEKLLGGATPYPVRPTRREPVAEVRFAVAGNELALVADVNDSHPSLASIPNEGSCVEVFGAMPRGKSISHIFLLPALNGKTTKALQAVKGKTEPAPEVKLTSKLTGAGYRLTALVPVSLLGIDPTRQTVLLEFRVSAFDRNGRLLRGTVFRSGAPHIDYLTYGKIRFLGRVRANLEVRRPLSLRPDAEPAQLLLTLLNRSHLSVADTVSLELRPSDSVKFRGQNRLSFSLEPGEKLSKLLELEPAGDYLPSRVELLIPAHPDGSIFHRRGFRIPVTDIPLSVLRQGISL